MSEFFWASYPVAIIHILDGETGISVWVDSVDLMSSKPVSKPELSAWLSLARIPEFCSPENLCIYILIKQSHYTQSLVRWKTQTGNQIILLRLTRGRQFSSFELLFSLIFANKTLFWGGSAGNSNVGHSVSCSLHYTLHHCQVSYTHQNKICKLVGCDPYILGK